MSNNNLTNQTLFSFTDSIFVVNGEMVENNGEDSYSFSINDNCGYVSVFDGCGGIGSRKYEEFGGKTGAYISSRTCAGALWEWFNDNCKDASALTGNTFPVACSEMTLRYSDALNEIENRTRKTMIKGSLTKSLPTTVSSFFFNIKDNSPRAYFAWAGDSRGFILTPKGLTQITRDDVAGDIDAFNNLSSDGNLTNFVSAGSTFKLNHKSVAFSEQAVLITATDGCFGYFSTPMEFEYMLIDTLRSSSTINEWKEKLHEYIKNYTGDDYTLGVAVLGFKKFSKLKRMFLKRHKALYNNYISKLNGASEEDLLELWKEYRKVYYRKNVK